MKVLGRIKNKKIKNFIFGIIIGLILCGTVALGRYAYKEIKKFYLASKSFYFNSDKLKEDGITYQVDNWSGADSYSITFNMNSFKNNKLFANSDIDYSIEYECSSNAKCDISKNKGTIYSSSHVDSFTIVINPKTGLKDGDKVVLDVKTVATSPYKKTLEGKFILKVGKMGLSYEISDFSSRAYLEVRITNTLDFYTVDLEFDDYKVGDRIDINTYLKLDSTNKEKCSSAVITLNFDPNVILLDMTTSAYLSATEIGTLKMENDTYINQFTFKIDALSSEVVQFYKVKAEDNYTYPFENNSSVVKVTYS